MKVAIFGATGKTGRPMTEQALALGYEVTAHARTPSKLGIEHENLTVVQGDMLEAASVATAVEGVDAVLVAVGSNELKDKTIRTNATRNVLAAMKKHGVERIVIISSIGVGDSWSHLSFAAKGIFKSLLKNAMIDHNNQEEAVRNSGLKWTIVRPSGLTDTEAAGSFSVKLPEEKHKGGRIARADVAGFVLQQVESDVFLHKAVSIG